MSNGHRAEFSMLSPARRISVSVWFIAADQSKDAPVDRLDVNAFLHHLPQRRQIAEAWRANEPSQHRHDSA